MIALVEGAVRQRTPNEIALSLVLSAFTLIFLIVTATLWPMARYTEQYMADYLGAAELESLGTDIPTLVALLVCLIPTTIGALLAAIGIAGMDRALRANIIAKSGKAVEVAGDVDTLLLDKTGTITIGNRRATQFVPLGDARPRRGRASWPRLAVAADETPEGKSIVELYRQHAGRGRRPAPPPGPRFIAFTAQTRMSGVDLPDGRRIRKGAPDAVAQATSQDQGGHVRRRLQEQVDAVASQGATPLLVVRGQPDRRPGRAGGHPQAGHPRAVRAAAADGPADRDGHRRQPADGQGHRRAGRRGRLHRPGDARGEAGLHPQGAGRAASSSP